MTWSFIKMSRVLDLSNLQLISLSELTLKANCSASYRLPIYCDAAEPVKHCFSSLCWRDQLCCFWIRFAAFFPRSKLSEWFLLLISKWNNCGITTQCCCLLPAGLLWTLKVLLIEEHALLYTIPVNSGKIGPLGCIGSPKKRNQLQVCILVV